MQKRKKLMVYQSPFCVQDTKWNTCVNIRIELTTKRRMTHTITIAGFHSFNGTQAHNSWYLSVEGRVLFDQTLKCGL